MPAKLKFFGNVGGFSYGEVAVVSDEQAKRFVDSKWAQLVEETKPVAVPVQVVTEVIAETLPEAPEQAVEQAVQRRQPKQSPDQK